MKMYVYAFKLRSFHTSSVLKGVGRLSNLSVCVCFCVEMIVKFFIFLLISLNEIIT